MDSSTISSLDFNPAEIESADLSSPTVQHSEVRCPMMEEPETYAEEMERTQTNAYVKRSLNKSTSEIAVQKSEATSRSFVSRSISFFSSSTSAVLWVTYPYVLRAYCAAAFRPCSPVMSSLVSDIIVAPCRHLLTSLQKRQISRHLK
jgi:hypothetical protein